MSRRRRPSTLGEGVHHLAVGEHVGSTDLEHPSIGPALAEDADQVGEHVAHGDRLAAGVDPPGRHHRRQDLDQVAQHLERRAARPDDDGGAQLGARHRARRQHLPNLVAASEVGRQLGRLVVAEPAQVDDLVEAGIGRSVSDVGGHLAIALLPVAVPADRVQQVVHGAGPGARVGQGLGIGGVAAHHVDRALPLLGVELGRGTDHCPHPMAGGDQLGNQPSSDVARCAEHEHRPLRSRLLGRPGGGGLGLR
jgi:hypothetical protein